MKEYPIPINANLVLQSTSERPRLLCEFCFDPHG